MAHIYAIDKLINGSHDIPIELQPVANKFHELHKRYKLHTTIFMYGKVDIWTFSCWVNYLAEPRVRIERVTNKINYEINKSQPFAYATRAFPEMKDCEWQWWDCNIKEGKITPDDLKNGKNGEWKIVS